MTGRWRGDSQGDRRRYHILHSTNDFRLDGTGITNLLADLMFAQIDAGHQVTLVTNEQSGNPLVQEFIEHGGLVHEIVPVNGPGALLLERRRLAALVKAGSIDVLHAHTVRGLAVILGADPRLARKTVFTVHNDFQLSSRLAGLAGRVVCVSAASQRLMQRRLPLRRSAVRVITNGTLGSRRVVPLEQVPAKALPGPTILFVGGLSTPRKGVEFLLEVFADVVKAKPAARLIIVGNRDNPRVEAQAVRLLPAGSYEFAGFCPEPRAYMKSATVLAVPSFEEPFGLVALEARSCGLPVVASEVGGLPEVLDGGAAGVLLPPGDRERWLVALLQALDRGAHKECSRPGENGALEYFSVSRMERDYAALYSELTGSQLGPRR